MGVRRTVTVAVAVTLFLIFVSGVVFGPIGRNIIDPGSGADEIFARPFCKPASGPVGENCYCDVESVDVVNTEFLNPILTALRVCDAMSFTFDTNNAHRQKKTFFNIFKVNYKAKCSLWASDFLCGLSTCAVCECEEDEIPLPWRQEQSDLVEETNTPTWMPKKDDWIYAGFQDTGDDSFVNLELNPERYTGYSGYDSHRIWEAIYGQNCFQNEYQNMCLEERFFYRVISGLHASISAHIAEFYHFEGVGWYPNIDVYEERMVAHPDRVKNLYFTYLFLLRALAKASPFLLEYDYNTGDYQEEVEIRWMLHSMLESRLMKTCSTWFDEKALFRSLDKAPLKDQMRSAFRNVSMIMDCVSCEKCRVHGKLQTLGIATALRIVFADNSTDISMSRNEIISLVQTVSKLSISIRSLEMMTHRKMFNFWYQAIASLSAVFFVVTASRMIIPIVRNKRKRLKAE